MSSEAKIVGYCRACGKALDEVSVRSAQGTIYCEEHEPMSSGTPTPAAAGPSVTTVDVSPYTASPYTSATPPPIPNPDVSPGLAFGLGFIPGVGAIYNSQYAKGLVHAIMIGLIISIMNSAPGNLEPLLAFLMVGFWIYMPFEAFHTAKRRQLGQPVDEFSSLIPMRPGASRIPVAPLVLIAIGVIFLLDNLNILQLSVLLHYWPVLLIVAGVYMLYVRVRGAEGGDR